MANSRLLAILATLIMALPVAAQADAINLPSCTANDPRCGFTVSVGEGDQMQSGSGFYTIDAKTGDLTITEAVTVVGLNGELAQVGGIWGNADPILGFNASAGTGVTGGTFSYTFYLPIALSGPLAADSSVSYSLTSQTAAGAQIAPLFGKTVIAQEVDTSVGGLSPLNKGVDVGNTFFFLGGPQTQNSPVYTAASLLTGNAAYDLMSVTVAFSLSARSNVGLSGFVQQTVVPVPAAVWLFGSAAGLLAALRRRAA